MTQRRASARFLVGIAVVSISFLGQSFGQATKSQTTASNQAAPKSLPKQVAYHLFFRHVNALNPSAAAIAQGAAPTTEGLKIHYQNKLSLTMAEHNALVSRAAACELEVATYDRTAKIALDQYRDQVKAGKLATPPTGEIIQLQAGRDALIQKHIGLLQSDMGPAGFKKVDQFINGEFAEKTTIQSLSGAGSELRAKRVASLRQRETRATRSGTERR